MGAVLVTVSTILVKPLNVLFNVPTSPVIRLEVVLFEEVVSPKISTPNTAALATIGFGNSV